MIHEKKVIEFMGGVLEFSPEGTATIQGKPVSWENNVKITVGKQKTIKLTHSSLMAIKDIFENEDLMTFVETIN